MERDDLIAGMPTGMTYQVLIVDDGLTVRMNLRDAFRAAEIDTAECATAAEARAAIGRRGPDLVILDILLIRLEEYSSVLDERGRHFLSRVRTGALRMGELVDGLLALSRVSRKPIETRPVRLDAMAHRILARFREAEPNREVEARIQSGIEVSADPALMESMMENLIGNAWKLTASAC